MEDDVDPTPYFNFPFSKEYCAHLGTNSSFRREALVGIGGFDEEYDYYLDETDVCVRMVDSGHVVKFVDDAFMHHKFLPSNLRNEHRVITDWYSIIKNQAYFAAKNAVEMHSLEEITKQVFRFIDGKRHEVLYNIDQGLLPEAEIGNFEYTADVAAKVGFMQGMGQSRKLISAETLELHALPFKRFTTLVPDEGERLTVCYLTLFFPPGFYGGIARFSYDLAYGLARQGHNVHVVTAGEGHDTVDFESGVWVHRIVPREFDLPEIPQDQQVSRRIHSWARTAFEEVEHIDSHHDIDIIETPIWDVEGLYLVRDDRLRPRTIVSLETTLKIAAEDYGSWRESPDINRAIEAEDYILRNAQSFHAISQGIIASVEEHYGLDLPRENIGLVPLGVKDESGNYAPSPSAEGEGVTVLFVGRLEPRKGIDTLLQVIPGILNRHPEARFVLVGEDTIPKSPDSPGATYKDEFLAEHAGEPLLDRVEFTGHVAEEELHRHYASCDIFVAPSRYESFGLIFLEVMMFAKPVIGCRAGGMVELIEDAGNGFLAEPDDTASLSKAIEKLIMDPALRKRFGERSRQLYQERFTDAMMVDNILKFYRAVIEKYRLASPETTPSR
jgi:hypothetical protein